MISGQQSAQPRVEAPPLRRWLTALAAAPAALIAFAFVAPRVALPEQAAGPMGMLAFACVSAQVLAVAALTPGLSPRALLGLGAPAAALGLVAWAGSHMPAWLAAAIVTAGLLGLGTLTGSVVGAAIEHPGHLVVVAAVSALVDVFSVLHPSGPTAQLIQVEEVVSVLILPWPILGTERIVPVLGVGDVVFVALYVVATRRHGLSVRRTLFALAVGLALTLAVVVVARVGVPALPFLGLCVVAAQPPARRVPRRDRAKAAAGVALLTVVFAVLFATR